MTGAAMGPGAPDIDVALGILRTCIDHTIEKSSIALSDEDPTVKRLTEHLRALLGMREELLQTYLTPGYTVVGLDIGSADGDLTGWTTFGPGGVVTTHTVEAPEPVNTVLELARQACSGLEGVRAAGGIGQKGLDEARDALQRITIALLAEPGPEPERPTHMTITEQSTTTPLSPDVRKGWAQQLVEDHALGYSRTEFVLDLPIGCTVRRTDGTTLVAKAGDQVRLSTQGIKFEDPREPGDDTDAGPEPHTGKQLAERTVASISDAALLQRAMVCLHVGLQRPVARWCAVTYRFGLGSTFARQLCKRFNLDPDEVIGN